MDAKVLCLNNEYKYCFIMDTDTIYRYIKLFCSNLKRRIITSILEYSEHTLILHDDLRDDCELSISSLIEVSSTSTISCKPISTNRLTVLLSKLDSCNWLTRYLFLLYLTLQYTKLYEILERINTIFVDKIKHRVFTRNLNLKSPQLKKFYF